jgi:putative tryptophan/tyrosine transport system substrate-binding protein
MMRRREFIAALGSAAALPVVARAQQAALPVVGFLHSGTADSNPSRVAAFRKSLGDGGFIEDRNVTILYHWANYDFTRLRGMASDLGRRGVAVVVVGGGPAPALAATAASSTTPIVLAIGFDPVQRGLVASLNRPGGNVTGATFISSELEAKRLDLLQKLVPQAKVFGYLTVDQRLGLEADGGDPGRQIEDILRATRALGRDVVVERIGSDRDFEAAFGHFVKRGVGGLVVAASTFIGSRRDQVVSLAALHKIPAIYQLRDYAVGGGLMSYGGSVEETFRIAGAYAARILKGAKPDDLPVQFPTKFELIINVKTAKALGLAVPETLLATADEVIQ